MTPKIHFIHGMFLTPRCWDHWIDYFRELGYEGVAHPWPFHEDDPAQLRAHPPEGLGRFTLADLQRHFDGIIRREPEPPVVIGHSLGGWLVQRLCADGLIRAGVAICPVPPNRMLALDWGFLSNSAMIANPLAGDDPIALTPELFRTAIGNRLDESQSGALFDAYVVPESRQLLRDVAGDEGRIDLSVPHVPLLFVGGKEDRIIPNSLVRRNAHAYEDERSHHEYTEFTDRGHFLVCETRWEEVAEKIARWLSGHLTAVRS